MKVIDRAHEWLKAEGYAPQLENEQGFLAVKYQSLTYIIPDTDQDETFLKIDLVFPLEAYEGIKKENILSVANRVSQDVKIAKATLREDNAIVYSAEVLVCEQDDFGKVLPRLFDVLRLAAQYFYEQSTAHKQ